MNFELAEDGSIKAPWWVILIAALTLSGGSSFGTIRFLPDPDAIIADKHLVTEKDLQTYVKREELLQEFRKEIRPIIQNLANIDAKLEIVLSHTSNHERRLSKLETQ